MKKSSIANTKQTLEATRSIMDKVDTASTQLFEASTKS